MFGIGTPELIVILVVALIVFGPEKLPQIAAQAGKAIRDFRQMSADLTGEFNRTLAFDEPPPAAALEPSPALSQETIAPQAWPATDGAADGQGAATGQNGHDAVTTPLAVETIPIDAPAPAATDTIWQEPVPTNGHSDESLLATKADPLAAVSLLEEPVRMLPVVPDGAASQPAAAGEAPAGEATVAETPAATGAVAEPEPALVAAEEAPASPAADSALAPEPVGEPDPTAEPSPIPDIVATDTVVSTAVTPDTTPVAAADEPAAPAPALTIAPAEVAQPAALDGAEAFANWDAHAPRLRVDPAAEMTIREKIEAQVAAEAFRERRRRAHYSRVGRVR